MNILQTIYKQVHHVYNTNTFTMRITYQYRSDLYTYFQPIQLLL